MTQPYNTFPTVGKSSRNTVIATATARVLSSIRKGNAIDQHSVRLIKDSVGLLSSIIHGGEFVEARESAGVARAVSADEVSAYGHGLAAVSEMTASPPSDDVVKLFTEMRDLLVDLSGRVGETVDQSHSPALMGAEAFFESLARIFYADIAGNLYPTRTDSDIVPHVLKGLSVA